MKKWVTEKGTTIYQVLSGRSNVFLISKGEKCILIDTSVKNRWNLLHNRIDKLCVSGIKLTALILTHAHFDHASNAMKIKEKYNAKLVVHRNEADDLSRGATSLPKGTIFLTKWFDVFGEKAAKWVKYKPVEYDVIVDERYDLKELGFDSYIMHTPGHTEGSISIIIDNEIAVVGDAMFGIFKGSIFPPFADNTQSMIESWKKLLDTECTIFLPSHGTANSRELLQKQYNKYRKIYSM